jgi:cystathionine beta-lyase
VVQKIAGLENTEDGLLVSSGMAAISAVMLTFLSKGDHCILQSGLYGGTQHFVTREFERFGITYSIVGNNDIESFTKAVQKNTRVIYVESPSNPLLSIIDLGEIARLSKASHCISVIDNTFASPINQNPINFGIDIVVHSATKYLGGHSDICAGMIVSSRNLIDRIRQTSMNFGGSVNAIMCYLLERSIKTLAIRVERQNQNAEIIAQFLNNHTKVGKVYYPGLKNHPRHDIARKQMTGFGGMLSFELVGEDPVLFQKKLKLIRPAMSLGGVESIICAPAITSHRLLTSEQRQQEGISDNLLRLSVGIENISDLKKDIEQALKK